MSITFEVMGEPRPKQSFRYTKNGGGFTPANVKAWQEVVAWKAKEAMSGKEIFLEKIYIILNFRLGNGRRIDIDNLSKAVLDAMNGIVYNDDTQVVDLNISKCVRKDNPGVTVNIDINKNKYCNYCESFKELDDFHLRKESKDGVGYKCKVCHSEYAKEQYKNNKYVYKKKAKEWAENNPERRKEIRRKSQDNRRDAVREIKNLQSKQRRAENLEHFRIIGRAAAHARKARMLSIKGVLTKENIENLLNKAQGYCIYCGNKTKLTLDHVVPVSNGGENSPKNIIPCCKPCNSRKSTKPVEEWLFSEHGATGLARAYVYLTRKTLSKSVIASLFDIDIFET